MQAPLTPTAARTANPTLGPQLVSRSQNTVASAPITTAPLAWWHLLSLDAPTVATLWTAFIAHSASVQLPWQALASMFVAVWMLYAADRLLDARPLPDGSAPPELEERHRFHHRHRTAFLVAIMIAAPLLAALLHTTPAAVLDRYVLLATLLAAWLLVIHARPLPTDTTRRLPKELAVGIFFPAAIFIPTVARVPHLQLILLPVAVLFAAVCTLNCLYLYAWEHPGERPHAHWTTRWATNHLESLSAATLLLCGLTLLGGTALLRTSLAAAFPSILHSALACALSTLLLLWLHRTRQHITPLALRAYADLVLLTPLLLWLR